MNIKNYIESKHFLICKQLKLNSQINLSFYNDYKSDYRFKKIKANNASKCNFFAN